jgi:Flp pilus assembly protein TadD
LKTSLLRGMLVASVAATALCFAKGSTEPSSGEDASRKAYADNVRSSYNYRFGTDKPSLPGNASVQGDDFIQPGAFPTAKYCGHCHQEAYQQWRQALHSNSFRTPFYRTSVNILIRTKGIEFSRHCDSCHNPIAVLSGALTQDSQVDRSFDQNGLTCTTCHSVQSLKSTNGNGGFVMGVPAVMTDEKGNRISGEVPDEQILKNPKLHSMAVMKSFYRTPEFCAACHKANLPDTLNDYKFIRAFTAYDEWQQSKFSQRNPLTFYTADFVPCQGCHMKRAPNTLPEPGAKHGAFATHSWPAGNSAVPFYYGFNEQLQKTVDFLQAGNYLNVDIFALQQANDNQVVGPLGSVPFDLKPKQVVQALVVIQNKNIGHSLIPEVRDLYEAWVEFNAKDATGNVFYHSGFIKPDGMLDERAHSFTNRPVNTDGGFVDNHKVWTIHSVAYDNSVPAGRSTLVRYQFRIPGDIKGPITITAKVNYRHFRETYLNNVFGKDHPLYPVFQLASKSRTLNIGENIKSPPEDSDNPDWMRWNNLGIAYLDQSQYSDAVRAFNEVVKLRPDYPDAYTNIALTEIQWEKYESAQASIGRALALSPDNARALYYFAQLARRASRYDEETAALRKVVLQYPETRDARRDLGIALYRQHDYPGAMEQFRALQQIDPDDLAAHYNLSILYRRMSKDQEAADQQAQFINKKFDPGAPTYSFDFLRLHPEISIESIPQHVHSDLPSIEAKRAYGGAQ